MLLILQQQAEYFQHKERGGTVAFSGSPHFWLSKGAVELQLSASLKVD